MKTVRATVARNNFQDIIDEVHYKREPIIITKRNKPWAVIHALPKENKK